MNEIIRKRDEMIRKHSRTIGNLRSRSFKYDPEENRDIQDVAKDINNRL